MRNDCYICYASAWSDTARVEFSIYRFRPDWLIDCGMESGGQFVVRFRVRPGGSAVHVRIGRKGTYIVYRGVRYAGYDALQRFLQKMEREKIKKMLEKM